MKTQNTKKQTENIKYEHSCNEDHRSKSPVIICNTFECPNKPEPCSLCPYKPIQFEKKNKKKDLNYYWAYYGDYLGGLILIIMLIACLIPLAKDENTMLYAYIHHLPLY